MALFKKVKKQIAKNNEKGAREALQEEWFNDYYTARHKVYKMNFVRGIFFGLGSALGGTIVVAIVIWIVALFVDLPLIGNYFKNAEHVLTQPKN